MNAVVVGIVNKDGRILMVKRAKKEGNLEWVFPGGKLKDGETKEKACIREIFEETGINVQIKQILGERLHPNTNIKITYFLCDYLSGQIMILDKSEIIDVAYKDKEEINQDVTTDIFAPVQEYIKKHI